MAAIVSLNLSTEIVFGSGCAASIGERTRHLGAERMLLISDAGLHQAGLVAQKEGWLKQAGLDVICYADVEPEPSVGNADACANFARQASPQVIVGLGGGSVLDTTKVVGALISNEGSVENYLGSDLVKRPGIPTILLPTTSGTGAEMTRNALFHVPQRRTKEAVISPLIVTKLALIDPALALSVPASVTAAAGVDALCHAIESYTGLNANPLTDAYALESIHQISTHLRRAVFAGHDLAAREGMALGSLYAAIALANAGTNGVHALAYPLQGLHRIAHGMANAMLLPYVIEFNAPGNLERFARVAQQMGQPIQGLSPRDAAAEAVRACRLLAADVGIPRRLCDVGIGESEIDALVSGALDVQRLLKNNPRPLRAADIEQIFRQAL
jgi:alcohol dehydrogenase class IV